MGTTEAMDATSLLNLNLHTPRGYLRDFQRAKLYKSEEGLPEGRRFDALSDIKRYVERALASKWLQTRFPDAPTQIEIGDGRAAKSAIAYVHGTRWSQESGRVIDARSYPRLIFPRCSRYERVVLHELAHALSPADRHGPRFATTYLQLIRHYLGVRVAEQLDANFARNGVICIEE